jgi:hypothetical protein
MNSRASLIFRRALIAARRYDEFDDPLLSGNCGVEFAAYLDEPVVDLLELFVYGDETLGHLFA